MNGIIKSKSTKLLSALLAVLMIVAMLPTTAFAWSVEEGTKCTSTYGDHYVGSDGEMFYSKPTTTAIFYNDDGSFYVKTYSSGNAKYKYMMIDGVGNQHHVYCIEGGVSFDYSDTYNSTSGKNSKYFQNLPITAQYGIMMALMYGYHEGMTSPIPGTNNDDFAFATQCIIWEYQQQLRTSPTSIASNNGIDADMYNHTIKGRPGSLDFIQCRDGKDTLIEDYAKTDDDSWRNPEIEGLVDQLKERLAERDKPIAPPPQKQRSGKVTPHVLLPEINTEYRTNFRIERDDIDVGTPLERFNHNRMAIQLLKKLEDEHRLADTNEQRILADYVGWGGLSDYFKEDNPHYQELKELLTEDEYASARESTLTAFYTPPVVIKAVYSALENMHFRTGNVLEPSCGIGNFMGLVPESMASAKFYGVELDSISGTFTCRKSQDRHAIYHSLSFRRDSCCMARSADRTKYERWTVRTCSTVRHDYAKPIQNRALRGQCKSCPRFAPCLRDCNRRISFLGSQLQTQRRARLSQMGHGWLCQQEIRQQGQNRE